MAYLIEFRFRGYAKRYAKNLIYDVAREFNVKGITRKKAVPHITLYGSFQTNHEKRLVSEIVLIGQRYNLVPFRVKGFNFFDNKQNKVIYLDIEPSEELKCLQRDIAYGLSKFSNGKSFDFDDDFVFHATVAFKDIDYKFDRIWNYIQQRQEPYIHQHLLRITIIKNGKILYEYDLMQKRLLNRRQALSKSYWNKTIGLLKQKTSDFNQDLEEQESFLDKIKNYFKNYFIKPKVFIASDLHLSHANIIKYCDRPFKSINEMNSIIVNNWNNTVSNRDTVYFLGDLSLCDSDYWIKKLHGKIIFIRGNHDKSKKIKLYDNYTIEYNKIKFFLTHRPENVPIDWDGWIIHGHKHNNSKNYPLIDKKNKRINASIELIDYKPISMDEIILLINQNNM